MLERVQAAGRELSFRPAVATSCSRACAPLGAKVLASATTVDEARWLEARGVDAIIAQGLEAGGHRGIFLSDDLTTQVGTLALVPQVVRAVQRAGDRGRRHRRRARRRGGARARRRRRAGRHRVPAVSRGDDERACTAPRSKSERRDAHGADECLHRPAGARHRQPHHARARADLRQRAGVSARDRGARAAARGGRAARVGRFSPLWAGQNASGCRERCRPRN